MKLLSTLGFLFLTLLILGLICYLIDKWMHKTGKITKKETILEEDASCCGGACEVCSPDSLYLSNNKIDYYDDEDLDIYKNREQASYTFKEIEAFEDVFYTLEEEDVVGWIKSLQLREIELPFSLKEEALLILSERRTTQIANS